MPKKVKKCDLEKTIRFCFEDVYSANYPDFDKDAVNIEIDSISATITYNHGVVNIFDLESFRDKECFDTFKSFLTAYIGAHFKAKILNRKLLVIAIDYDIVD